MDPTPDPRYARCFTGKPCTTHALIPDDESQGDLHGNLVDLDFFKTILWPGVSHLPCLSHLTLSTFPSPSDQPSACFRTSLPRATSFCGLEAASPFSYHCNKPKAQPHSGGVSQPAPLLPAAPSSSSATSWIGASTRSRWQPTSWRLSASHPTNFG